MEIAENSNELRFDGEMEIDIEDEEFVKNFAQMGISSIPCLGKYNIWLLCFMAKAYQSFINFRTISPSPRFYLY